MTYQTKAVALELKSFSDDGTFTGYGSVFNITDQGGDVVESGAFGKSLKTWQDSGRVVPVLWQHRSGEPIGSWNSLSEDNHGLIGKAALWVEDAPYAKIAYKGMKEKTITGLSIGYHVKRESLDRKAGINRLHELELVEISVVTNPMNDAARVDSVKSKLLAGDKPTLREFEELLREKGFSRSEAESIAAHGFKQTIARECDAAISEVFKSLTAFSLT